MHFFETFAEFREGGGRFDEQRSSLHSYPLAQVFINTLDVMDNVIVGVANNLQSESIKELRSLLVILDGFGMAFAVDFYYQPQLRTIEINYVSADWFLATPSLHNKV